MNQYTNYNRKRDDNGIIFFLLVPFFRPDFISEMYGNSLINKVFTAWRVIAFIYILIQYYCSHKWDNKIFIVIAYEAVMMFSCLHNHVSVTGRLINIGNFLGIYFIYSYYAKRNPDALIRMNFRLFSWLIVLNLLLTVIFPNGFNNASTGSGRINFLGKDNTLTFIFLLAIIFAVLYSNLTPKSKKPALLFGIIIITELYYFSGSGMVAITFLVLYMLFLWKNSIINRLLNANIITIIFLALEYLIVFLNRTDFLNFVFKWLNKTVTFTDRRYYWNTAISQLLLNPVLGQGHGTVSLWNNGYYSHNAVLDVLLKGGILGGLFWIIMILIIMNGIKLENCSRIKGLIMCVFLSFLAIGLMEGLEDRIPFNAFLAIASVVDLFEEKGILNNRMLNWGVKFKVR